MTDNIIEQLQEHASDIQTYRNPPQAPAVLRTVLTALGHPPTDAVRSLWVSEKDATVNLEVGWYIRGCDQSEDYEIPLSVFLADDPEKATKLWSLKGDLASAQYKLDESNQQVRLYQMQVEQYQKEIDELNGSVKP